MQACLLAKQCFALDFGFEGVAADFSGASNIVLEARLKLDAHHECLLEALQLAFAEAGCEMPGVPALPPAPDLASCSGFVDSVRTQVQNPLGFLGGLIQIELDSELKPVRITVS
jgi:hypothetical protein